VKYKFQILTFGDGIITKPSSAALSRNFWIDPGEDIGSTGFTGFEMANEVVETDPFVLGVSMTLFALTEAGIGGGRVLCF